jgi:hypothetical protein
MAEAADDAGPADAMGWGRAAVIPAMGSVLVAGHSPLGALALRVAAQSVPLGCGGPFGCDADDEADMVDVPEACEERLDDELDRWALFRGINMPPPLDTPSALHACRLMFW